MLRTDAKALDARVEAGILLIREKEMNLFSNNLNAIGTQVILLISLLALLVGSSLGGTYCWIWVYYLC